MFKREGKIKDIILPRKRDKYGNRIGFLVAENSCEADKLISSLNNKMVRSKQLYLTRAKDRKGASNSTITPNVNYSADRTTSNAVVTGPISGKGRSPKSYKKEPEP